VQHLPSKSSVEISRFIMTSSGANTPFDADISGISDGSYCIQIELIGAADIK
jgi:hypothetical protein